jgi:hypothetical protein
MAAQGLPGLRRTSRFAAYLQGQRIDSRLLATKAHADHSHPAAQSALRL